MVTRRQREQLEDTFSPAGWREEWHIAYRQRKSIIFVVAGMVAMQAFWNSSWAWVLFFFVLGIYSALAGVRVGMVCCFSFTVWFFTSREWPVWYYQHEAFRQGIALWCIATLAFVIVWKKDGAEQIRLRRRGSNK